MHGFFDYLLVWVSMCTLTYLLVPISHYTILSSIHLIYTSQKGIYNLTNCCQSLVTDHLLLSNHAIHEQTLTDGSWK